MKKFIVLLLSALLIVSLISCEEPKAEVPPAKAPAYIDEFKLSTEDSVVMNLTFDKAEDAEALCPQHACGSETGHDGFVESFKVAGGVGSIYSNSACAYFEDIDPTKTYTLEYKIKLDPNYDFKAVENNNSSVLSFNYGERVAWNSEFVSFVAEEEGLFVYDGGSSVLNETKHKIEADKWYTIKTVFAPAEEGKTVMKTTILIGEKEEVINEMTFASQSQLYWNIYFPAAAN